MYQYAVPGALLAELILRDRITVDRHSKGKLVGVVSRRLVGEPLLDECLAAIATAKRPATAEAWVLKFVAIKQLKDCIAERLCRRGVLREEEGKTLRIFTRREYPPAKSGGGEAIDSTARPRNSRQQRQPRYAHGRTCIAGAPLRSPDHGVRSEGNEKLQNENRRDHEWRCGRRCGRGSHRGKAVGYFRGDGHLRDRLNLSSGSPEHANISTGQNHSGEKTTRGHRVPPLVLCAGHENTL